MIFHQTYKKIADLVDLEWFLARWEQDFQGEGGKNSAIFPDGGGFTDLSDTECLGLWLKSRREESLASSKMLPGNKVVSSLNIFFLLTSFLAFGLGAIISFGILHYDGHLPINLLHAFGVLVFLPFATVLATLLFLIFYRKRRPISQTLVLQGLKKLLFFMLKGVNSAIPGEKREDVLVLKRGMEDFSKKYAPLVRALLFFACQLGGFFFVAGMFCAFLVKVAGSDLAFAWQSTLNFRPEDFARFLEILGSPWEFFFPAAIPDLGQIEGSRVFLKEGIAKLSGEHLAAWWRFMAMALLVYGFFPRFLLMGFASFMFRKRISASIPDDSRTRSLCFFLRNSVARSHETENSFWEREVVSKKLIPDEKERKGRFSGPWELWISEEIPEEAKNIFLREIQKEMGAEPEKILFVDLGDCPDVSASLPLVFALEVFMPPVLEDLRALQNIAEKREGPFWIWPVGRKDAPSPYTPEARDLVIWGKKLESLQEPRPLLLRRSPDGK